MKKLFAAVVALVAFVGSAFAVDAARPHAASVEVSPKGEVSSPAKALEVVCEMRKTGALKPGEKATVKIAPGRYEIEKALEVTGDVSPIAFVGPENGEAVISGGRKLGPFVAGADGVWTCDVPKGFVFEQLWVNGVRAVRAKSPNKFYHYVLGSAGEQPHPFTGKLMNLSQTMFKADQEALALLEKTPKDEMRDVIIHVWWAWDSENRRAAGVDKASSSIVLANPVERDFFMWPKYCPRFTIENCRAALDAPGEWFLDRKASRLYYVPRSGEHPNDSCAIAPVADRIVNVRGASDVRFENLTFAHNGFKMPPAGIYEYQSGFAVDAAITVGDARFVTIDRCHVTHTANYGIWFDSGVSDSRISHTLVDDIGAGGVRLGGRGWNAEEPDKVVQRVVVDDNIITDGGHVFPAGTGVFCTYLKDSVVTHNEICDMYYSGICCGWRWGYAPAPNRRNEISWNHIHHLGKGVLSDMGFIYTLGDSRGTVVKGNHGHDIFSYGYTGSGGTGLYPDEGSYGILWTSNLIHHTKTSALSQHYGKENLFVNNIFAFNTKPETSVAGRWRVEDHTSLIVSNNVFVWSAGHKAWKGPGAVSPVHDLVFGKNLWWSPDPVAPDAFNGDTFEAWQKSGMDAGSIVADPLFRDWRNGDWRLKPESPALALGFKEWDYTFAGVRKEDTAWRAKAESLGHPSYDVLPVPPVNQGRRELRSGFETLKAGTLHRGVFEGVGTIFNSTKSARSGKQSLEFRDAKGQQYVWIPHAYQNFKISSDRFRIGFSLKFDKAANFGCELREYSSKLRNRAYAVGLTLSFADGKVVLRGRRRDAVGKMQPCSVRIDGVRADVWHDVVMDIAYDQNGTPTWAFAISAADGSFKKEEKGLFFSEDDCARPQWIGFMSNADCETVTFIDDYFYENL